MSNLRVRHYSSVEEPSTCHIRTYFLDGGQHSCSALPLKGRAERSPCPDALPGKGLTFVFGTLPQEESRAQFPDGGRTFVLDTPLGGRAECNP
ncbi:unnamed protein product [Cuscuta campestris]|uniref:Uncharacterized protein n=1 Tax=Cuscuta campestris TaxID=132261 RepID=A0A484M7S7_9ASTE|nr:unnamed protein product [Cuscuta campestris]